MTLKELLQSKIGAPSTYKNIDLYVAFNNNPKNPTSLILLMGLFWEAANGVIFTKDNNVWSFRGRVFNIQSPNIEITILEGNDYGKVDQRMDIKIDWPSDLNCVTCQATV